MCVRVCVCVLTYIKEDNVDCLNSFVHFDYIISFDIFGNSKGGVYF